MRLFFARTFIAVILVFWSLLAMAVSHQDFTFQLSPASNELSQQTVRDIFEDSRGFLWFLTQEGLNRFDGYEVIRFRANSAGERSLSHQSITSMLEDAEGNFWITTAGGGLNKLFANNLTVETFRYSGKRSKNTPISNVIMSAMLAKNGDIWLGYGQGAGYSVFNPESETFTHYPDTDNESAAIVRDFAMTDTGHIWMAIEDKGLYKIDPTRPGMPKRVSLPSKARPELDVKKLTNLMTDQSGRVWVSSFTDGLIGVDTSTDELRYISHELGSPSAGALEAYVSVEDDEENIWVGTTNGIQIISANKQSLTTINTTNSSLPDNQIFSLKQSESGIVWVGTYNGLAYGTKSLFERYASHDGLSSASTNAFAQTDDGIIWIANDAGIDALTPVQLGTPDYALQITNKPFNLPKVRFMSLLSHGNNLWAGTLNSGLFHIDRGKNEITHYQRSSTKETTINSNGITSLLAIDQRTILIGTYGGGLNEMNIKEKTFKHYTSEADDPSTVSNDMVVALHEDSLGNIWVGTEKGINRFDHSSGTFLRFESKTSERTSLSSDMAWAMDEDTRGNLWVGTQSGGLHMWKEKHRRDGVGIFNRLSDNVDIPSADIYTVKSTENSVWLSHNQGVTALDIHDLSTINFDVTDGLQGPEFNHGAAFKDRAGYLYFGGPDGFNRIDPRNAERSNLDPPLRLTSIKLLNKNIYFDTAYDKLESITLKHDFDFITFTVSSLDYKNPSLNKYRYKLQGLNDEWIDLGSTRQVSFTRLPTGSYQLILQGTNSDGVWSTDSRSLGIVVTPPFWMTWWAYIIYAIFATFALAYAVVLQKRKTRMEEDRRRELEEKVKERTTDLQRARITAENATKAKSEFLAAMTHEIRTPMHGMLGMTDLLLQTPLTDQQSQFAKSAKASGETLLTLVNAILDFSKIEAQRVDLEAIEFDVRESTEETCYLQREAAYRKGIDFNLQISPSLNTLYYGDSNKFKQIITNLVGNAIKFTDEGSVLVKLAKASANESKKSFIVIKVIDTGIGIDESTQMKIFDSFTQADTSTTRQYGGTGLGLTISKRLIDIMDGSIEIDSSVGRGTEFTVKIPLIRGKKIAPIEIEKPSKVTTLIEGNNLQESAKSILEYLSITYSIGNNVTEAPHAIESTSLAIIEHDAWVENLNFLASLLLDTPTIFISNSPSIDIPRELKTWRNVLKPLTLNSFLSAFNDMLPQEPIATEKLVASNQILADSKDTSSFNVLVVEDVEINQRIAGTMLEILGASVSVARDGKEAIEHISVTCFDIVFMDCQMPVMDGLQATHLIRNSFPDEPTKQNIPIIALTAGGNEIERERALNAGMDFYITKPFTLDDVKGALDNVFDDFAVRTTQKAAKDVLATESETHTDTQFLDIDILDGILTIEHTSNKPLLEQLLSGFICQAVEKKEDMLKAVSEEDFESIRSCAHAIKSMSANIGAIQIKTSFDFIERNYETLSVNSIKNELFNFEKNLDTFYTEVQRWRYSNKDE